MRSKLLTGLLELDDGPEVKWRRLKQVSAAALLAFLAAGFLVFYSSIPADSKAAGVARVSTSVACLGRVEPEDGVRRMAAPFSMQGPSILSELLIREGDFVVSNQVLAVTANHRTAKADLEIAESQAKVARGKLTRIQTGEKAGDIAAQLADLQRAEAEWQNAQKELKRDEDIWRAGGLSQTELDRSRLAVERGRKDFERAREKLNSIKEIREVDLNPAVFELEGALASARRAEAELERTLIRAPFGGQVIKIHARPGEEVGRDGVLELARTDSMYVRAEVYETDIHRIKPGLRAEITGDALADKLSGRVTYIGMKVDKNKVLTTDPAAFADGRVVEVMIRLEDSRPAAARIHAQVDVQIFP